MAAVVMSPQPWRSFLDTFQTTFPRHGMQGPERRFDDITKLCCMVFKVPIALVSLVDRDRQWFKSAQGLDARETDRKSSFCAW